MRASYGLGSARQPSSRSVEGAVLPVVSSSISSFTDRQAHLGKKCQVLNVNVTASHAAAGGALDTQDHLARGGSRTSTRRARGGSLRNAATPSRSTRSSASSFTPTRPEVLAVSQLGLHARSDLSVLLRTDNHRHQQRSKQQTANTDSTTTSAVVWSGLGTPRLALPVSRTSSPPRLADKLASPPRTSPSREGAVRAGGQLAISSSISSFATARQARLGKKFQVNINVTASHGPGTGASCRSATLSRRQASSPRSSHLAR